jgi:ATP-dependent RNA helicase DeaD
VFSAEMKQILQTAGYNEPTKLQHYLAPQILEEKDIFLEIGNALGKTASYLVPLIYEMSNTVQHDLHTLIICKQTVQLEKIQAQLRKLIRDKAARNYFAVIGMDPRAKNDISKLKQEPKVIISTAERIIDHVRRNNLSLDDVNRIIVDLPDQVFEAELDKDIEFIVQKISNRIQKVLLAKCIPDNTIFVQGQIIGLGDWAEIPTQFQLLDSDAKSNIADVLTNIQPPYMIISGSPQESAEIADICKSLRLHAEISRDQRMKVQEQRLLEGVIQVLIAELDFVPSLSYSKIPKVIFSRIPAHEDQFKGILAFFADTEGDGQIFFLTDKSLPDFLKEYSMKKIELPMEESQIKDEFERILKTIREQEDPIEMDYYKKLVKKHVPFFMRSYIAAYFMKRHLNKGQGSPRRNFRSNGDMTKLFVSIGKNRKVFPKDLSKLFAHELNMDMKEVGAIKVLDSYSFVDIPSDKGQKAIDKLNGTMFKGRKITVNFARRRD